jgi:hypothetical protein
MSTTPNTAANTGGRRFRIRYSTLNAAIMGVLGVGRSRSWAEVGADHVVVRMGIGFRMTLPRPAIVDARRLERYVWWGYGVHGWRGRWLVNGSGRGIVALSIDPPVRAWVLGFPVRLRELLVSLEDPPGFLAAIGR